MDRPSYVIWDMTYACPLRCVHCYSESGRRPSLQPSPADMERIADALVSLRPDEIAFSGGEPLVVRGALGLARRIREAGVRVSLYTSGWTLTPELATRLAEEFTEVHVSVDGATAATHDRIRGRRGSFARALGALSMLDDAAARRPDFVFGVDSVVVRSNLDEVEAVCRDVLPRYPRLAQVLFGAVIPSGLASRSGFARLELLGDEELARLCDPEFAAKLRALVPGVNVQTTTNRELQMHPDLIAEGMVFPAMQVEPDGGVRAMPIYEGTVGNILTEDPGELWRRAVERWSDPFVTEVLRTARTWPEWAAATRRIDERFGSAAVRERIGNRPAYPLHAA